MQIKSTKISPFNFQAGLTKQIQSEIRHCDVKKITNEFAKMGVEADFKNNKTVAWCSYKCAEIFKSLKLSLPTAIIVEDFRKLKIEEPESSGFNNVLPAKLYPNSEDITLQKSVFFNSYSHYDEYLNGKTFWDEIDLISDYEYEYKASPTNHFLYHILHEFVHSAHEDHLLKNLGVNKTLKYYLTTFDSKYLLDYQNKYRKILEKICPYAAENPNESVACDFSKRIADNLTNSLNINTEFIKISPYKNLSFKEFLFGLKNKNEQDFVLRKIWFGIIP